MKKTTQILGWVGAVIMGLGLISRLIQQRGSLFISLHLAMGAFFILVSVLSNLPEIRAFLSGRLARVGTGAFARIILLLLALVIINYVILQNDYSYDLTARSLYSLSRQTHKVLKELPAEVKITAFLQPDRFINERRRLELYRERSDKIRVEFVDPDKHPEIVAQKGIEYLKAGSILFESGGRSTLITQGEEADITNALIKVSREESPMIYFLAGHGEADIQDKDRAGIFILAEALRDQNYRVENLVLAERVPEDAAALIIAAPRIPLTGPELEAIDYYITQGGNVLFLIDPTFTSNTYQPFLTGLESFLKGYGLLPGFGVVVDPFFNYRRDTMGLSPLCRDIKEHPVTHGLEKKILVFPQPRPLVQITTGPEAGSWRELALTSERSYVETNLKDLMEKQYVHQDRDDPKGPFIIAAATSWKQAMPRWQVLEKGGKAESRLLVVGNSQFLRNGYIETYSNFQFAMNAVNWLAGEEKMIHLQPKKRFASRIYLSRFQMDLIFYLSVLILPELLLIAGVGVWWRKR